MVKVAISIGHGSNTFDENGSKGLYYGDGLKFEEHDNFNAYVGQYVVEGLKRHGVNVLVVQEPFARDVPLHERTKLANDWGADLYWSIHANANANESAKGVCAWYAKGYDKPRKLALMWARNMKDAGFELHGNGTHASDENIETWQIRMWELWETTMTSVLTENGFFTHPETRKKMLTDKYRKKVANVHIKTILDHVGIAYKPEQKSDTSHFEDIQGHWAEDAIKKALDADVFNGYADGTFRPDEPLTRAQAAQLLSNLGLLK